jgi:hypothetical protein
VAPLAALLAVAVLAGCSSGGPTLEQLDATKRGDGVAHHDVATLAESIPAAAAADAVTYYGGVLATADAGRPEAPGPSDLWIDAVLTFPQGVGSVLAAQWGATPEGDPDVVALLDTEIPACDFLGSYDLDQYFSDDAWTSSAWLCAETDQVVLAAWKR